MTSLIDKIEQLIKREKTTPERKEKDDSKKSSNEILSELFSAFNADPPKIEDISVKKSKKTKKKHKKEKKKRTRSYTPTSDSEDSEYSHKRKKKKKTKSSKKRKDHSPCSPPIKVERKSTKTKHDPERIKKENVKEKVELSKNVSVKVEETITDDRVTNTIETSLIPMPESPKDMKLDLDDLHLKLDKKDALTESDKAKSKIQIKNLKFSTVFEETVKKAEEEAKKKAEKFEEGEYTDSSSVSEKEEIPNSQFPKSSDLGGIVKKPETEENKMPVEIKPHSKKAKNSDTPKPTKRDRSRSKKRSSSRSKRSKSRSPAKRRRHRSHSRSRRRSRSKPHSPTRTRRRSRSRSRNRHRHVSPRHRPRRSRSQSRVKLADSEKKRLLEVARRNAINMLKNGAVPAGAAALPPHARTQVLAAIHSGGKSVDELTDFCKHLSKKEALGELSSVSSNDGEMSENEDTLAFHHPFLVKEKAPIVMNIRGGAPLPIKSSVLPIANKDELRIQFPVSSGSQHREKATEWVPVSPKKDNMQVAKLNRPKSPKSATSSSEKAAPLALPAPPAATTPPYMKGFQSGSQLTSVPALPAPGPQAYPPGVEPPNIDLALIVSQKLSLIRKEQEDNEISLSHGFGWSNSSSLGQFTGTTGAQILTPRELASGTQAWAKKLLVFACRVQMAPLADQLVRAAPVAGGMGMHLLQKMGWCPGQGLGKEGTGTLQPLLLEVKLDTRGLQAKEELKPQRPGRRGPAPLVAGGKHPVSLLGEYCSKHKLGPPEYNLCFECGPDHKKNFLFRVKVAGVEYQPAVASANKKQAKADAAQLALQKIGLVL